MSTATTQAEDPPVRIVELFVPYLDWTDYGDIRWVRPDHGPYERFRDDRTRYCVYCHHDYLEKSTCEIDVSFTFRTLIANLRDVLIAGAAAQRAREEK